MKLDPELTRTILLRIEADPSFDGWPQDRKTDAARLGISGHTDAKMIYHLTQLVNDGLVVGNTKLAKQAGAVMIARLTPKGHQFLDDIRDPDIWEKTKDRAQGAAQVGLGLLWELAKAEIKQKPVLP
jgi:hypothetical protein